MPDRTTDKHLLEMARAGDGAAFLELYQIHRESVFRFAYRLSGTVETAEDITHDCFLSLIKRAENFDSNRAALRTYLFSAARNLWFKRLRTFGREETIEEFGPDRFVAPARQPLAEVLEQELSDRVKQAVASLPPLQREAIVLFEYEGFALSEIAEMVGADVGAVKARLHRARNTLKTALQPYLNTDREIVTLEKI